jgi:hypothetical protein
MYVSGTVLPRERQAVGHTLLILFNAMSVDVSGCVEGSV